MAHERATRREIQSLIGIHPRPKWGPLFPEGKLMDSAKEFEKAGMFYAAGCRYIECGKHRLAFGMARMLIADPERKNEGISNFELAARLLVKLWKDTYEPEWANCVKRLAKKALASGRQGEAERIFEDAGFIAHAERARSMTPPPIGNASGTRHPASENCGERAGILALKSLKETSGG